MRVWIDGVAGAFRQNYGMAYKKIQVVEVLPVVDLFQEPAKIIFCCGRCNTGENFPPNVASAAQNAPQQRKSLPRNVLRTSKYVLRKVATRLRRVSRIIYPFAQHLKCALILIYRA